MKNVAVCDAQYVVRLGLVALMDQSGFEVIGHCDSIDELNTLLQNNAIDVLIMDYNKTENLALTDLGSIRQEYPKTNILAISDYQSKEEVLHAIELGVLSFLTKDCDKREIVDAVAATAKGEKFFCNRVLDYILEGQITKQPANCRPSILSSRELEVVEEMARGAKAKDIADVLNLSIHTVYTHQKNIMKKIGVNSSTEIVLYALNEGLIDT